MPSKDSVKKDRPVAGNPAQAVINDAGKQKEPHLADVSGEKTRVEQAEARAEQAETRTEQAKTRTEMAEMRTEQAETRTEMAKTRTGQAETRTEQAEARTEQAEKTLQRVVPTHQEIAPQLLKIYPLGGVADTKSPLARLTGRQLQILKLIAEGQNTKQIAEFLALSPKTIEYHRLKLMGCLNLHDIPSLVRFALRVGLLPLESRSPNGMF